MKAQDGRYQSITGDVCEKKFRNMKQTYTGIKDNNKSTGRKRKAWEFMALMDEIFENSPHVTTLLIIDGTQPSILMPTTQQVLQNPPTVSQEMKNLMKK